MRSPRFLLLGALLATLFACGGGDGPGQQNYPTIPGAQVPPDFTLTDANPDSATNGQALTLSEQAGSVVTVYFVSYG